MTRLLASFALVAALALAGTPATGARAADPAPTAAGEFFFKPGDRGQGVCGAWESVW